MSQAFERLPLDGQRVPAVVLDSRRTAPIALFFRVFYEALWGRVPALDYLIALDTDEALSQKALHRLAGITAETRRTADAGVNLLNQR